MESARLRGLTVGVSAAEAYALFVVQDKTCALSGVPLGFRDRGLRQHTASFDRIDSSLGYVDGNVQWVHKDINMMKNNTPQDRFIDLCRKVTNHAS